MDWENNVRKVVPYTPGEQPKAADVVKLNTNENPYPPSPAVSKVLASLVGQEERLRLYPDPRIQDLGDAIAQVYGVRPEEVFVGVGSDDVLAMLFMTFFNSDKPILFPDITYSFYDVWADMLRIPYEKIPLDAALHIRPRDYKRENGGIVIANPNAPTGVLLPVSAIEEIVAANPGSVVIVDEAYVDFGGQSALPLIHRYDNVVITQTFSKSRSMAGLRIGYALGCASLIKYLNDVKYSFNSYTMSWPAILLGTAEMLDTEHFRQNCRRVMDTRQRTVARLRNLGFTLEDSCANFVFAAHPKVPAKEIFDYLRSRKVFVRWFNQDRIRNYLRISIGTDADMDRFFETLEAFLKTR